MLVVFIFPPFSPIPVGIDAKFVAKIGKNSQFPLRKSPGFRKMGLKMLGSQERGENGINVAKKKSRRCTLCFCHFSAFCPHELKKLYELHKPLKRSTLLDQADFSSSSCLEMA